MFRRSSLIHAGLYLVFLFSIMPLTLAWLRYGCLPAYDLGIFTEALVAGWHLKWDPFLATRESFMLQDHWDPITLILGYLTSPFSSFLNPPVFLLWFEATVVFVAAEYARAALRNRGFDNARCWLAFLSILGARATWNALHFPVHPTTWVLLPHLMLVFWYFDFFSGHRKWELSRYLILSVLIWLCGEQFALGLAAAHVALVILAPRRRLALTIISIFVLFAAWWAMHGRIWVHGSIYNHAARVTFNLSEVLSKYEFDRDFFRRFAESMLVYIAPVWLLAIEARRLLKSRDLKTLLMESRFVLVSLAFASPMILGRLLSNSWRYHYGVMMGAVFMTGFVVARHKVWNRNVTIALMSLAILSSTGDWSKILRMTRDPAPGCSATTSDPSAEQWQARLADIEFVEKHLPPNARILVGVFLVPTLQQIRADLVIHTLGPFKQLPGEAPFDYLWLPKTPFANHWPLSPEEVEKLLVKVGGERTELGTSVLVKGSFSPEIFDEFQGSQSFIYLKDSKERSGSH